MPAAGRGCHELALKHKRNLTVLGAVEGVQLKQGLFIGAVWVVYQVAKQLGIEKALGTDFPGKLAMWQVIARIIEQGSRLSAVRLAKVRAMADVLSLKRGFDENDLYENLTWLNNEQDRIEDRLFAAWPTGSKPELFLYGDQSHCVCHQPLPGGHPKRVGSLWLQP